MNEDHSADKPWWKRHLLGIVVLGVVALAILANLFVAGLKWRAAHVWQAYRKAREAEGEHFELRDFALAPVPDDENFYKTPFLTSAGYGHVAVVKGFETGDAWGTHGIEAGSWKKPDLVALQQTLVSNGITPPDTGQSPASDVLEAARLFPEVDELRGAVSRKYSQCDPIFDFLDESKAPNYVGLRRLFCLFTASASAELSLGQNDDAIVDARVIDRLVKGLHGNITLVAAMIRVGGSSCLLHIFWEGWQEQKWTDAHLAQFEDLFLTLNLVADVDRAIHVEPIVWEKPVQQAIKGREGNIGTFLITMNLIASRDLMRKDFYPCADPANGVIFPERCESGASNADRFIHSYSPFHFIASMAAPNYKRAFITAAKNQAYVNEAALVCALERFRHARGHYPASLDELAPVYIASVPKDPIDVKPFHYRLDGAKFLLYSVGWNEKDDGGTQGTNDEAGDWVWR